MKRYIWICLWLCFSPSLLQAAAPLDIAGISIGHSPKQVQAAMKAAGFQPDHDHMLKAVSKGLSFEEIVKSGKRIGKGNAIKEMRFVKEKQEINVKFIPWPDGEKVSEVFYRPNNPTATFEDLLKSATKKYGPPSKTSYSEARWSRVPLVNNNIINFKEPHIHLSKRAMDRGIISLMTNRLETNKKLDTDQKR